MDKFKNMNKKDANCVSKICNDSATNAKENYQENTYESNETSVINSPNYTSCSKSESEKVFNPSRNVTDQSRNVNNSDKISSADVELESIGLSKIKYDIEIDPNVNDRYTNVSVELLSGDEMPPPESPETKKKRIEKENMIVARQCRLHPSNKKYNQGPVVNPPPITPGTVVGYTPAGQRHEVDLNFERPTWFNSEYARMQFDDATRINVSRMFHDLETGMFLPSTLDPYIERKYFAEQELVTKDASKHFENQEEGLKSPDLEAESEDISEYNEHLSLLDTENKLIELNKFAAVRVGDFRNQLSLKLRDALNLKLTPLMFKKNPVIIETLQKLVDKEQYDLAQPARSLLEKIMKLFTVPDNMTFKEYFASEVEKLKEKTRNMNGFDVLMMTEEPLESDSEIYNFPVEEDVQHTLPGTDQETELEDVWIPVGNDDLWIDAEDVSESVSGTGESNVYDSDSSDYLDSLMDASSVNNDVFDDSLVASDSELSDSEDDGDQIIMESINGMLFHGYPGYIVLSYFEYI